MAALGRKRSEDSRQEETSGEADAVDTDASDRTDKPPAEVSEYIGTEHILLGLIKEGSGVAANVLKNLDVDLRKIRLEVEKLVQSGPDMVTMGKLPQTPRAKKVIEYSMEEARNLNHNYVGTEHILLGLLREQEGVAAQVLMNLALKLEEVREEVLNLLGHGLEGGEAAERAGGAAVPRRWRSHRARAASPRRPPWTASAAI